MRRLFALALAGLIAWCSPAFAVYVVGANVAASQSNVSAHSITTGTFSAASGVLLIALGNITGLNNAADAVVVTDNAAGAIGSWTTVQCPTPGATTKVAFVSYAYAVSTITTKTITVADTAVGGTNWTSGAFFSVQTLTGMAASSPEDTAVRACGGNTVATTTPNLTSGVPTGSGEFFVAIHYAQRTATGATFSEDTGNGWTAVFGPGGGANQADSISYNNNASPSAVPHNPVTTSAAYAHQIMGFCPTGGCSASPVTLHSLSLLGVGQ